MVSLSSFSFPTRLSANKDETCLRFMISRLAASRERPTLFHDTTASKYRDSACYFDRDMLVMREMQVNSWKSTAIKSHRRGKAIDIVCQPTTVARLSLYHSLIHFRPEVAGVLNIDRYSKDSKIAAMTSGTEQSFLHGLPSNTKKKRFPFSRLWEK